MKGTVSVMTAELTIDVIILISHKYTQDTDMLRTQKGILRERRLKNY